MEEVANRIQDIIKSKGISNSEMADSINLPRPILSHILSGRNKPSLAVIQKITETYSDIDVKWLLTGKASESIFSSNENSSNKNVDSALLSTSENTQEQEEKKISTPSPTSDPKLASQTERQANSAEITEIVHYFADGTFKVFTPNA